MPDWPKASLFMSNNKIYHNILLPITTYTVSEGQSMQLISSENRLKNNITIPQQAL